VKLNLITLGLMWLIVFIPSAIAFTLTTPEPIYSYSVQGASDALFYKDSDKYAAWAARCKKNRAARTTLGTYWKARPI
jgi:hypothetical protein